jgi:hypothetical protein
MRLHEGDQAGPVLGLRLQALHIGDQKIPNDAGMKQEFLIMSPIFDTTAAPGSLSRAYALVG